jgi:hypothetical protein
MKIWRESGKEKPKLTNFDGIFTLFDFFSQKGAEKVKYIGFS